MLDELTLSRVERIKSLATISSICPELKPHGSNTCPLCGRKGKCFVKADTFFICYSSKCEVKGDVIKLHQLLYGNTQKGGWFHSLTALEKEYGINTNFKAVEDERARVFKEAAEYYHYILFTSEGELALDYLRKRGFSDEFIVAYSIGYAPMGAALREYGMKQSDLVAHDLMSRSEEYFSNRIIFPIRDMTGRIVHMQGRWLGDVPKDERGDDRWPRYKDSKAAPGVGSSKTHLVFEEEIKYYQDTVIITEGYPDALILRQVGFNALGILGLEGLTKQSHKFEHFKELIIVADNDYFPSDHDKYPNEYKSWRKLIPQLIELQILNPHLLIRWKMVPDRVGKDVNDWYLKEGAVGLQEIFNAAELIPTLIERWGPDISKHQDLLRVLYTTGHPFSALEKFVPQEWGPIEYAMRVMGG